MWMRVLAGKIEGGRRAAGRSRTWGKAGAGGDKVEELCALDVWHLHQLVQQQLHRHVFLVVPRPCTTTRHRQQLEQSGLKTCAWHPRWQRAAGLGCLQLRTPRPRERLDALDLWSACLRADADTGPLYDGW
eukprot:3331498-Rhodomonas_salina.2